VRRALAFLVLMGMVVAGCGTTPEPTAPPPTQTPWIVIVTSTAKAERTTQVQPTETARPAAVAAVATKGATATPTERVEPTPGTPGPTVEATEPQPSPTSMEATVPPLTPTATSEAVTLVYDSPTLLEPPPNRPVSWRSTVLLKWTSVGELAEDEYYNLELQRPAKTPEDWYGDYIFTKVTEYLLPTSFLAPFHFPEVKGQAVVYWWVRVVRQTGEDQSGKPIGIDISLPSGKSTLILDPKPEGQ
jgi:hypothetical protein